MEIIRRRVIALALLLAVGVWPLPGLVPRGLAEAISRERSPSDTVAESAVRSHLGRGTPTDRFFIHHPGDPVNIRTGNLTLPAMDLSIPSRGPSLTLTRTYNSRSSGKGFFGQKWQSNLEVKVMRSAGTLAVMEADGALIDFKPEGGAFAAASGGLRYRSTVRGIQQVEERPDGSVLRQTDAGNRELFDPRGRLVRIEDRNGNALRLEYQGDKVIKLVDPGGRSLILSYGGEGGQFVTTVTHPAGGVFRYQYDARGRLLSVTDQAGREGRYEYDNLDRLVRLIYADGAETRMTYERNSGAVLAQAGPGLSTTSYRYEWEAGGLMSRRTTVTDAGGRHAVYEYAQGGREVAVIDPSGRRTVVLYDPDLYQPLSVSGPKGILASYQYDSEGRLLAETNPLRQITRYRYDAASGFLLEVTDAQGHPVRFEYDARGNRVALIRADGGTTRDVYDARGQIVERTDPTGARTQFRYDQSGNLIERINASGQRTQYGHDILGRMVRRLEANGAETRWSYNGVGDLVKKVDAEGRVTEYTYDAMRRLTALIDPAGRVRRYEYDAAGQPVAVVDPAGGKTVRSYTPEGRLREIKDPSGVVRRYEYDRLGRRVALIDGLGHRSRYEYDAEDYLVAFYDPTGVELRVEHDAGGRPSALASASARTTLTYDAVGHVEAFGEPDGRVWRYRFNPLGNVTEVLDPAGGKSGFQYDATGRLIRQIDPAGRTVSYRRDSLGRVVDIEDPLGPAMRLAYDGTGNVVSTLSRSGKGVGYEYDRLGRVVAISYPDGSTRRFEYDRSGNPVKAARGSDAIRYTYDALNRLTKVEYARLNKTIWYAYDAAARRTEMVDPAGGSTHYRYDGAGRLSELTAPGGATLKFAYDPAGRLTEILYPNGVRGKVSYNAVGMASSVRHERGGKSLAGFTYQYDGAGRLVAATAIDGSTERYGYDGLSRLQSVTDAKGNRIEYAYHPDGSRARTSSGSSSISYSYDAAARLTAAGHLTFRHDPDGNLVEQKGLDGATKYEYDADRRLVKVITPSGDTIAYGYDPDGQRYWRRGKEGVTHYLHDGLNLVAELDEQLTVKAVYLHGDGLDAPLVMMRNGKTYYYHPDRLGSVLAVTDDRGQVVASYSYDPFGSPKSLPAGFANPFLFTAREYDPAVGLYHYRAREYDPSLGRFLTKDPLPGNLLDPRTLHPYLYVSNNPLSLTDPLGLAGWSEHTSIPGLPTSGPIKPSDIANIKDPFTRAHILQEINSVATRHPGPFGVVVNPTNPATLMVWPNNAPPVIIHPKPIGVAEGMANIPIPQGEVEIVPATKPPGATTLPVTPEPVAPVPPAEPVVIEPAAPGGPSVAGAGAEGISVGGVLTGIAVIASAVHIATADDKLGATIQEGGGWVGAIYGAGVGAFLSPVLGPLGPIGGGLIGGIIGSAVAGCLYGPCPPGAPPPYLPPVEPPSGPVGSMPASGTSDGPISVISDQPPPPGPIVGPPPTVDFGAIDKLGGESHGLRPGGGTPATSGSFGGPAGTPPSVVGGPGYGEPPASLTSAPSQPPVGGPIAVPPYGGAMTPYSVPIPPSDPSGGSSPPQQPCGASGAGSCPPGQHREQPGGPCH